MCKTTDKNSLSHLIKEHFIAYPQSMIRDILKFIHQGAFGCEHMVSDEASAIERIKGEYSSSADSHPSAEKLSEGYSRVSLSYLDKGLCSFGGKRQERELAKVDVLSLFLSIMDVEHNGNKKDSRRKDCDGKYIAISATGVS